MRPRQNIIEIFSMFLQFNADRSQGWVTEPKLRRSILRCLEQSPQPENSENFWALYWHKVWQTQPHSLAAMHLSAYLQEACYWAAKKISTGFVSTQYTLADCFQIAIAKVDKVIRNFNSQQGFSLKNYGSVIFTSVIKEVLRQRQEVDVSTDWALLRKISQKRLEESLQNLGLSPATIASYLLAWKCFKTVYVPTQASGTRQLPAPAPDIWEAIAALYNAQRLSELRPPGPECRAQTLEKWLVACAKATRSYLYPTLSSINTPKPGQESEEWLDNLPQLQGESLLTNLITTEEEQTRQSQQAQINDVLVAALAKLDAETKQLLQLYYSQGLTQQQIALQLQMKQYTVSRRLTKSRESLLQALAEWSQQTLHISLTSSVLKNISAVLDELLQNYYS
jgi:RNA polymerase sigma factor (sigma-70 family)